MMQKKYKIISKNILTIFLISSLLSLGTKTKPQENEYGWDEKKMYIDFEKSMQTKNYFTSIAVTKRVVGVDGVDLYKFFKKLYEKNNLTKITPSKEPRIPKIIHVVWINGKIDESGVPEDLKQYIVTWIEKHLGDEWQFKLWTDADVAKMKLQNQDLYDDATNYGVKSDILKYEIVYNYGGVYVDTDFECLKRLDIFHHCYDFYVGIQPLDTQYLQLGAALFGATPGHPILKHTIESMRESYYKHKGAPAKTGPVHFTRAFFESADKTEHIDIAFPASYFYPLGGQEKTFDREKWNTMGAFAVHWWGRTWMPAKYRNKKFKNIQNEDLVKNWNE